MFLHDLDGGGLRHSSSYPLPHARPLNYDFELPNLVRLTSLTATIHIVYAQKEDLYLIFDLFVDFFC